MSSGLLIPHGGRQCDLYPFQFLAQVPPDTRLDRIRVAQDVDRNGAALSVAGQAANPLMEAASDSMACRREPERRSGLADRFPRLRLPWKRESAPCPC